MELDAVYLCKLDHAHAASSPNTAHSAPSVLYLSVHGVNRRFLPTLAPQAYKVS